MLARLLRAWAPEQGLEPADAPAPGAAVALRVEGPAPGGPPHAEATAGRDGWSAPGRFDPRGARLDLGGEGDRGSAEWRTWLAAAPGPGADPVPLVAWAPGRVRVAWSELEEPVGDPAAFAVSWADLLERACLPVPGAVPLEHRLGAGEARLEPPREPPPARPPEGARAGPVPLDAWLAALAAAAALAALVAGIAARSVPRQV